MDTKQKMLTAALTGIFAGAISTSIYADGKTKSPTPAPSEAKGECHGVNECKGKGACGGKEGHSCAGKNSCKGKGWLSMTKKECKDKKGTFKKGM